MDELIEHGEAKEKMSGGGGAVHQKIKMLDPHPDGCHSPNSHDYVHPQENQVLESSSKFLVINSDRLRLLLHMGRHKPVGGAL
jgi:hypothetical protein